MNQTSEICTKLMQDELIKHLWAIVDECNDNDCFFILSSRRLGDGKVQDITILSGNSSSHQTVFGYKPVDMTIEVTKNGNDFTMLLLSSVKTKFLLGRIKCIRSASSFQRRFSPTPSPHFLRA